jgi:hypothetical protein
MSLHYFANGTSQNATRFYQALLLTDRHNCLSCSRFVFSEGDEFQIAWSLLKDQGCLNEAKVSA